MSASLPREEQLLLFQVGIEPFLDFFQQLIRLHQSCQHVVLIGTHKHVVVFHLNEIK